MEKSGILMLLVHRVKHTTVNLCFHFLPNEIEIIFYVTSLMHTLIILTDVSPYNFHSF
jgi:hypothetical protein